MEPLQGSIMTPPKTSLPGRHHVHVPIFVGISRKADFFLPTSLWSIFLSSTSLLPPFLHRCPPLAHKALSLGVSHTLSVLTASENLSEKTTSLFDF